MKTFVVQTESALSVLTFVVRSMARLLFVVLSVLFFIAIKRDVLPAPHGSHCGYLILAINCLYLHCFLKFHVVFFSCIVIYFHTVRLKNYETIKCTDAQGRIKAGADGAAAPGPPKK